MNQQPLERSLLFQDREYVDIDLNFTKARSTDIAKKKGENAIKQALKVLLLTGPAERLFHPELASGVRDLLFDLVTPTTAYELQLAIEDVINNFEPRVSLVSVDVSADPDEAAYDVSVEFSIVNQPKDNVQLNLFLERLR
jgi:phage baseplate assembly protein W